MLVKHVALVSETSRLGLSEVARVSAALQKQVVRDFGPIWNVTATVDAFGSLDDVPIGYWPVIVKDDIGFPGAGGVHLDKNGSPYALVNFSADWALTTSHEILEMLADPFGNRTIAGQSKKPKQGRVEFLVEVSDPSEAAQFGYTVNGITVSDFYTPHFFDPVQSSGVSYSFTGAIKSPRQVLRGGYLSWHDPITDHWFQETWFSGTKSKFVDLGILTAANGSIRSQIDALTYEDTMKQLQLNVRPKNMSLTMAATAASEESNTHVASTAARAASLRSQIEQVSAAAKAAKK